MGIQIDLTEKTIKYTFHRDILEKNLDELLKMFKKDMNFDLVKKSD